MMGYLERQAKAVKQALPCHSYPAAIFFSLLSSLSQTPSHFPNPSLYKPPLALTFLAWKEMFIRIQQLQIEYTDTCLTRGK